MRLGGISQNNFYQGIFGLDEVVVAKIATTTKEAVFKGKTNRCKNCNSSKYLHEFNSKIIKFYIEKIRGENE